MFELEKSLMADKPKALLTDLYQLTMGAAYLEAQKDNKATFDLFIRKLPKDWGYLVAAGIDDAIDYATKVKIDREDIEYLKSQELFKPSFLDYLKNFQFDGDIYAVREGTPIAANSPILRLTGRRIQVQLLETALLNTVNFQTLVASKASRITNISQGAKLAEFGLRRAHGSEAGLIASKAAFIGGFDATSDVEAGKRFGIPISGTHAHSFVMSFPTELEAFRAYVNTHPKNPTLLIDTYDLKEGAENATIVAHELESLGKKLGAVRIDSGDLVMGSKLVRAILDYQDLSYVKIIASNDLDEYAIADLIKNGARIDGYGIGTRLVTGHPDAALPGVYKLAADTDGPKIKLSLEKRTNPGVKQVFRQTDENSQILFDVLGLDEEKIPGFPILEKVVENGERVRQKSSLIETRNYSLEQVSKLSEETKLLKVEHPLRLVISQKLEDLTRKLVDEHIQKRRVAA